MENKAFRKRLKHPVVSVQRSGMIVKAVAMTLALMLLIVLNESPDLSNMIFGGRETPPDLYGNDNGRPFRISVGPADSCVEGTANCSSRGGLDAECINEYRKRIRPENEFRFRFG